MQMLTIEYTIGWNKTEISVLSKNNVDKNIEQKDIKIAKGMLLYLCLLEYHKSIMYEKNMAVERKSIVM